MPRAHHRTGTRLPAADLERLEADAAEAGVSVSEILRRRVRQEPATPAVKRLLRIWFLRSCLARIEAETSAWEEARLQKTAALDAMRAAGAPSFFLDLSAADAALAVRQVALLQEQRAEMLRELANLSDVPSS